MRKLLESAVRLAAAKLSRTAAVAPPLPVNLTVSVTYSCPSRCATCDIWKKKADDLRLDEWEKIFRSLGTAPLWVTVSGGDQFLRRDLPDIVALIRNILQPSVINLPMNGVASRRIEELLPKIVEVSRGAQLVLNLSIDDIGERHDAIRGARHNFEKIMAAHKLVRALQRENPHVVLGIHTVISRLNVERIPEIHRELAKLEPDSYITEVAEERVELGTVGKEITPSAEAYARAASYLQEQIRLHPSPHPTARLVQALRLEYYDLVKRILVEHRQVIPCLAGRASAQIAPDGEVWGCCVRAESFGNLRDADYDFRRVWHSQRADEFRRSVRANECACPLANAAYTNMLLSPASLLRVTRHLVHR